MCVTVSQRSDKITNRRRERIRPRACIAYKLFCNVVLLWYVLVAVRR